MDISVLRHHVRCVVPLCKKGWQHQGLVPPLPLLLMILTGAAIGAINEINLYLSGAMPGIIFFPIVNGGVIILSALSAILLFRERLPKMQLVGLIAGIISVLCLGM